MTTHTSDLKNSCGPIPITASRIESYQEKPEIVVPAPAMRYVSWRKEAWFLFEGIRLGILVRPNRADQITILGATLQLLLHLLGFGGIYLFFFSCYGSTPEHLRTNWTLARQVEGLAVEYFFRWIYTYATAIFVYMGTFDRSFLYLTYLIVLSQFWVFIGCMLYGLFFQLTESLFSKQLGLLIFLSLISVYFTQKNLIAKSANYGVKKSTLYLFVVISIQTLLVYANCALFPRMVLFKQGP
ncbi:hypothetical protein NEHOM01_1569 [Nematocida homosporus]|uniref:uncharacterized protein n=1 Tax=Nematocida homosporus TaxID=1912981 RepID=UPI00221E9F65|nr:uncharacterized protein NEHOM01_1569 [Nematocida homosporus]KAI5186583.1 hypothetical protein NEHOM01_1569 [Nematocida homosporus]